jgi:nucleotide-binding universal stress UspA family protein
MRILLCVDDLPTASHAIAEARLLVSAVPADVILLAIADSDAEADQLLAAARAELSAARSLKDAKTVGAPLEDAVALLCQGQAFDLVMVAPAGRRGLSRLLHGSRVVKLVRQAVSSVWIARRPPDGALRRILVGVSGAPHSEIDVRFAAHLARAFGPETRLTVLHVVSQVPLVFTGLAHLRYNLEEFMALDMPGARQLKRARAVLDDMGTPGDIEVREGLVSEELVAEASQGYDLLVMGAHVGEGMVGLLLDNITEHVLRECPISTLVVRSEPAWERLATE